MINPLSIEATQTRASKEFHQKAEQLAAFLLKLNQEPTSTEFYEKTRETYSLEFLEAYQNKKRVSNKLFLKYIMQDILNYFNLFFLAGFGFCCGFNGFVSLQTFLSKVLWGV